MPNPKILFVVGIAIILFGCSEKTNKKMEHIASNESTSNSAVSSIAAVENGKDTTRRFVRTADLKFKVKSVINSTYNIEDITNRQGGFVTFTNLNSTINNTTLTAVSADSSLETTFYTVTNTITLRVPNVKLDTTLKEIAGNIDYLDYRIIKADDVALQILANDLTQKRAERNEARLANAIDNRGKKLNETTEAEELLLNKQAQADYAKVANLSLADQVKFSTINLSIYQRETIKRELISNYKNIDAYEQSITSKILEAIKSGWNLLVNIIVFLTNLWAVILMAIIVYVVYKKFGAKIK